MCLRGVISWYSKGSGDGTPSDDGSSASCESTGAEAEGSVSNPNPVVAVENEQIGISPAGHERYPTVAFMRRMNNHSIGETCFVTRTGGFYHRLGCRWIEGRVSKEILLTEAIARGLGRCRTCHGNGHKAVKKQK